MDPTDVLPLYRDGIESVTAIVRGWGPTDWQRPACGHWTGADVAHHLLGVIQWYHAWLDRALAGERNPPFPVTELAAQNARTLAAIGSAPGSERIAEFSAEAERYERRLPDCWDLPYGYPYGTVTAGLHAGVAAAEWHLHAWDLATSAGADHRPGDPGRLLVASATCQLTATGGLPARMSIPLLPTVARRDPWGQLLRRSGRR